MRGLESGKKSATDPAPPRDSDAWRAQLREVAAFPGLPVVCGGCVRVDTLVIGEFFGTRTGAIGGPVVAPDSGLGGLALRLRETAAARGPAASRRPGIGHGGTRHIARGRADVAVAQ
ncbi:hypothetical protein [Nocardia aurantia]|uniref:Uncharacterized protein n=1 Tax=Nocardia aurantia TaxID=2585199 RepID=A0A7K0E1T4_9NOCA|nr:hypothetical protein [Nocardia aurantia]MQY31768.1 hypothetical protein [Nocardia aurantia]